MFKSLDGHDILIMINIICIEITQYFYLSKIHVLFDSIHPISSLCLTSVHVRDHRSNVTHDGGEYEDSDHEVYCDKQVLDVLHRLGGLT